MNQVLSDKLDVGIENTSIFHSYQVDKNVGIAITSASTSSESVEDMELMTWWIQIFWTVVFSLMISIAIGGNCLVIWIVTAHRRMRSVTNYFLVNLSVADLMLSTLNCSFNFIYMLRGHWAFGSWYCTVNNFMANVTVSASVFTLTGISCDRYLAIVHPLQPRMSKTSSLVTIGFVWCASMALAIPCLLYSRIITYSVRRTEIMACILEWPDGKPNESNMDFMYQVTFLVVTYLVPMVLMIGCYSAMGRILWGSHTIGEMTQRQLDSIKSKRKVVKMFIFIVLTFGMCWFPYHAYFIYTHYDKKIVYSKYVQHIYLGFYWFAMANAMINPLIYYWMNARFRQYFKTAICSWRRILNRNNFRSGSDTPPIIGKHELYLFRTGTNDHGSSRRQRRKNTMISRILTEKRSPPFPRLAPGRKFSGHWNEIVPNNNVRNITTDV